MKISGARIVWETLLREGVNTVFGYPGGSVLPLYDTMLDYPIHHVLTRHEQGAVHMADGFARAGGGVGVAIATSGPGTTNMVTGIATAYLDSSPIVCITGQVSADLLGYDAFQEVDTTGITMPITKHNYLVTDIEELGMVMKEAFHIARSGRPGPVLVDIPKDVQTASVDWNYDTLTINLPGYESEGPITGQELNTAIKMISQAKKPIILAGRGILISSAEDELRKFAEKTQTPVAATLLGIGCLPAEHPLYLGMMGLHGDPWVNQAIQKCDLVIALGMRFDDRATGKTEEFAPFARKIHIDIDPTEINKNVRVDLGIAANLKDTLSLLNQHIQPLPHSDWLEDINTDVMTAGELDFSRIPDDDALHGIQVISRLWQLTHENALIVTDVGQHQMWAAQYFKIGIPNTAITSGGLGTMGFSLPAAIGAKFAQPGRDVWVINGDGSFQMTQSELSTIRQENLKINIAVINNGYLGMVRQLQDVYCNNRHSAVAITSPDLIKIAEAHGLDGIRVTHRSEIDSAIHYAQESKNTVLIDFQVEKDEMVFPMVPAGASLENMIRRSS